MGDNTYPASDAILFVAIGRLQRQASRARGLYREDLLLRAADAALLRRLDNRPYPDVLKRVAEADILLAADAVKDEAAGAVAPLVSAGEDMIARAMGNTRRTVRRRHDLHCPMPPEELQARDRAAETDDWLDFKSLAQRAPRLYKEVLLRRARGQGDREIAAAMKLQQKYVPVLVHRAIISVRKMMAKSPIRRADATI
jgi:hypothetical protein